MKDDCALKCANCAHYQAETAQCRRFPPVPVATEEGVFWGFPECDPDDYCGEFGGKQ